MIKLGRVIRIVLLVSPFALTSVTGTYAQDQHPLLDKVAAKVIQKYETTPCQELMQKKANPQPPTRGGSESSTVSEKQSRDANAVH